MDTLNNKFLSSTLWQLLPYIIVIIIIHCIFHIKLPLYFISGKENEMLVKLHTAVVENNVTECIKLTQKYPILINIPLDNKGYTPFLIACLNGNTQLVKFMINYGADISIRTAKQETAFYLAAYYLLKNPSTKNASCIHALYHAGADINAVNDKGYNALHLAACFGHIPLIKWLLAKNANIHVTPNPIMLAKVQGHKEAARIMNVRQILAIEF